MRAASQVAVLFLVASVCFAGVAAPIASAQDFRNRSQKRAVRGMTGDFDGLGMVLWISRDEARRLLPNPNLQLDYPGDAERHPVVVLLGAEHNVGVQFRNSYVHPRFLKEYDNAYVIVPYLRHPVASGHVYIFSKIFVSDERVTERGTKLNNSPKVHAAIQESAHRFVVNYEGARRVDLEMQENPSAARLQALAASASTPRDVPATADLLRTIFRQPKIEFSPKVHLFAFDFMADASHVTPAIVAGMVRVPAVASAVAGDRSGDILLLSPNRPVEAIRFSSHWVKSLQH